MNSQTELTLESAGFIDDIVRVEYSLVDDEACANVQMDIRPSTLANFIEDEGYNQAYYDAPDECTVIPASLYLVENLRFVVEEYLKSQLS